MLRSLVSRANIGLFVRRKVGLCFFAKSDLPLLRFDNVSFSACVLRLIKYPLGKCYFIDLKGKISFYRALPNYDTFPNHLIQTRIEEDPLEIIKMTT